MSAHQARPMMAVYSIAPRAVVGAAMGHGGEGVLRESRRWVTARQALDSCRQAGEAYALLLADASCITGVEWVAEVVDIVLEPSGGTTVHFKGLRELPFIIRRGALRKGSDGLPLSDDYIRPYVPCTVKGKVAAQVRAELALGPGLASVRGDERQRRAAAQQDIDADPDCQGLDATTRLALVEARLGQGGYRARLLALWGGRCAVTGCSLPQVLVASHAKPWRLSGNSERLDEYNGLLLAAHVDRLFDAGLIGFDDGGQLLRKAEVGDATLQALGLSAEARLAQVHARHKPYLAAHRAHFGLDCSDLGRESQAKGVA